MAFGQGVVVTGGVPVLSCGAMQPNVTTALTHQPPFFVALIRTYTHVHKPFAPLVFHLVPHLLCSPAVGKVRSPRRGHPLVEIVILIGMD